MQDHAGASWRESLETQLSRLDRLIAESMEMVAESHRLTQDSTNIVVGNTRALARADDRIHQSGSVIDSAQVR